MILKCQLCSGSKVGMLPRYKDCFLVRILPSTRKEGLGCSKDFILLRSKVSAFEFNYH